MRKLFSDPHFNVMDGLDTYIDDYGKPDPIPESMLRQLNQSKLLRLFEIEEDAEKSAARGRGRGISRWCGLSGSGTVGRARPLPPRPYR